ncbi:MAG: hypothetical protein CMH26_03425 [Micavibrio sp.]|nr:hypothetical protein [Micavibrio sp.]|tara:strand:+ start:439 stop:735 length:297 start_codon:yes stop_codon:yes gene_type:complete
MAGPIAGLGVYTAQQSYQSVNTPQTNTDSSRNSNSAAQQQSAQANSPQVQTRAAAPISSSFESDTSGGLGNATARGQETINDVQNASAQRGSLLDIIV